MEQEKVWDSIARKWQEFRVKSIKEAIDFIKNSKGRTLDLGCGSGRNFTKTKGTIYAVDFSKKMLNYAKEYAEKKGFKVITKKAKAEKLPFKNNFFDRAIFIATLHCIKGKKKREKALKELYRVLKPGAKAMITVWDKNQSRFKKEKKEIMLPWRINRKRYMRYYYLYDKDEIIDEVKKIGFKVVKISDKNTNGYYSKRNIILVVRKIL